MYGFLDSSEYNKSMAYEDVNDISGPIMLVCAPPNNL